MTGACEILNFDPTWSMELESGVESDSGDCDASASDAEQLVDDVDCLNYSVDVERRRAHAHKHFAKRGIVRA
jgi:hypothetical protein